MNRRAVSVLSHSRVAARLENAHGPIASPTDATTWPTPSCSSCCGAGPREEEAVLLVDLGEVHGGWDLAFFERAEALRRRRLADVHGAGDDTLDGRLAGRRHGGLRHEALVPQEAAGDRRDQRRVERREARELDADLVEIGRA